MNVESMDDVADCLLSVAWNIFPLMGKPPASPGNRTEEIRTLLVDACHDAGMRAREWAAAHGAGTEEERRPFLRLAEIGTDANLFLGMVSGTLVADPERIRRRWAEIETLVIEAGELAALIEGRPENRPPLAAGDQSFSSFRS
ncbi:hypothetical protein [Amycolatopsis keratiniphila]|uniref:Uncharacterized protein n=1 Tax=Amycolatopsis keratiniphila TaxID=129921 RepID=R4SUI9_9PSEU|nr:hypothetical protein [Amycolatopsis keratiniphila]AGM06215.1 hypothetical protein AORI_3630 [Amycolatopsis keratiniphila]